MKNYPELVIIGYTNIDINISPNNKTILPGGAAYFVACAASLETKNVGLVTRIGFDFDPKFLLTRVAEEGVKIINDKETAKSIQTYHSDDPTDRDVELKKGVAQDLNPRDIPNDWIENAKIIHVATMPPEYQGIFLKYVKNHKKDDTILSTDTELSFVKNSALKPQIIENLKMADLLFVNRLEYELLKTDVSNIKEIIVKKDKDGAVYILNSKIDSKVKTKTVNAVDSTGAGDVFAGTYLACRINGKSVDDSLEQAANIATKSIVKEGVSHLFE